MPLIPFPVEQFGGLNLISDATEIGMSGAVIATDVMLDKPGQIRTREGYVARASTTAPPVRAFLYAAASTQVLAASITKIEAFTLSSGASLGTVATTGTRATSFVQYGTPSTSVVYSTATGDSAVRKWDGSAFSTVAAAPVGIAIAHTLNSNRLVIAGHGNGHRVQFSDAGAPETWTSTSWVDVTPGDGETIYHLVRWQDKVFAFKQSKFAVFTGESTLSDGSPVFNYRMFDGLGTTKGPGMACAAPSGVYFMANDGVYRTTGGAPVEISRPIRSMFLNRTTFNHVQNHLCWAAGRLYAVVQQGSNSTLFVYDERTETWTQWSILSGKTGGGFASDAAGDLVFVNGTDQSVFVAGSSFTDDNGTAIAWSYTTGYSSAGGYFRQRIVSSGERKKHFKTDIIGSGTVTHQVLALNARPNDVADTGGSVTLGTSPAIARGSRRRGVRGTYFAHKLSGSGPAVVSGLTYWLSEISQDT